MHRRLRFAILLVSLLPFVRYPLDAYERTGIRRLEAYRRVQHGELRGRQLPEGALLHDDEIRLHLTGASRDFDIGAGTPRDPYLQEGLEDIFRGRDPQYSIAILEITDPANPRYAALREDRNYIPGSVGKMVVMTGLLAELADAFPDTIDRIRVLRETRITADAFIKWDHHAVPIVDLEADRLVHRPIRMGDVFSLWEWVDHMASPSSNAAASTVWKEAMLLDRFGSRYPATLEEQARFFSETDRSRLGDIAVQVINDPLRRAGLSEEEIRQGTFFTDHGQRVVPGSSSYASPHALLRYLIRLEQGRIVDTWTSRELKKLLYFTRRRYRYASAPRLREAAVYFKSGSLYSCEPEPGFECGKYRGNQVNYMNSVAIVESPARGPDRRIYLVALMSNVLRRNAAVEHQTIATYVDRLIRNRPTETVEPSGATDGPR